jgi:PAS domain S-box-containing protein
MAAKKPTRRNTQHRSRRRAAPTATAGRSSEELFRLAVEASPSGMLMVDEAGRIVLVNTQVEHLFGYTRDELLGQSVEILVPQRLREHHLRDRKEFGGAPSARQMGKGRELWGQRKNGTEFPVEIGLNPIRTAEGMRVLAAIVDITERRRMEEQLRRTERLAELGTLSSGMAHEIGTPMNVILGRAEYLMQRIEDPTVKKGLETIVAQVERITKIMNQLLTFARRRPMERRPMDLRTTIADCLDVVQERLARYDIKVETDLTDAPESLLADPDQMSQVLLNLVLNAIHAMPSGGTLRLVVKEDADRAVIRVSDTGHGIPTEYLSKVFDPFFTTKDVGKGTGLGLTVVHGIIHEHGGSIAVESEVDRGTTFTITLPLS